MGGGFKGVQKYGTGEITYVLHNYSVAYSLNIAISSSYKVESVNEIVSQRFPRSLHFVEHLRTI